MKDPCGALCSPMNMSGVKAGFVNDKVENATFKFGKKHVKNIICFFGGSVCINLRYFNHKQ